MIFAKREFQSVMPLYFLEFVTNVAFSRYVPLSDFYKSWISGSCAIRLFHRLKNIRLCDIKYLALRRGEGAIYEEKSGQSIKSLPREWAVLRQKSRFHSDFTERE